MLTFFWWSVLTIFLRASTDVSFFTNLKESSALHLLASWKGCHFVHFILINVWCQKLILKIVSSIWSLMTSFFTIYFVFTRYYFLLNAAELFCFTRSHTLRLSFPQRFLLNRAAILKKCSAFRVITWLWPLFLWYLFLLRST